MSRFGHHDQRPTTIHVDLSFTVNGGDIRDEELARVRKAMVDALATTAGANGMTYSADMKLRSISPKSFTAWLGRRKP